MTIEPRSPPERPAPPFTFAFLLYVVDDRPLDRFGPIVESALGVRLTTVRGDFADDPPSLEGSALGLHVYVRAFSPVPAGPVFRISGGNRPPHFWLGSPRVSLDRPLRAHLRAAGFTEVMDHLEFVPQSIEHRGYPFDPKKLARSDLDPTDLDLRVLLRDARPPHEVALAVSDRLRVPLEPDASDGPTRWRGGALGLSLELSAHGREPGELVLSGSTAGCATGSAGTAPLDHLVLDLLRSNDDSD